MGRSACSKGNFTYVLLLLIRLQVLRLYWNFIVCVPGLVSTAAARRPRAPGRKVFRKTKFVYATVFVYYYLFFFFNNKTTRKIVKTTADTNPDKAGYV